MRYEDFVIQIGPDTGHGYSVSVVKSPAGEGSGSFRLPFDEAEIGQVFGALRRHAEAERSDVEERELRPAPISEEDRRFTPRQVGSELFRSLFAGQIRTLFDQSVGSTSAKSDTGLRIQIKLNPEHPDLARLYSLPWEFLFRPDTQDFLSLSRLSPVVRYLDVSRPTSPFPLPSPLRILVVIASPKGLAGLDLKRERTNIESAWGRNKNVEVVFLQEATLGALREELLEGPFHVLHFMGHGGFDDRSGEGVLYFVGPDGSRQPISGHVLASKLKDFKALRLVFLNACNTAKTAGKAGVNPFAGVASALVLSGIPAVVAMQLPISDRAAIAFSRAFYQRLSAGESVDTAVAEGRQAVHSEDCATTEWATPVLFLRTPDGALFSRSTGSAEALHGGLASSVATTRPGLLSGATQAVTPSLLSGNAAIRKNSKRGIIAAIAAISVIASLLTLAIKIGISNTARPHADAIDSEMSNPVDASGRTTPINSQMLPVKSTTATKQDPSPITIKKAAPAPTVVIELDHDFRTSVEGLTGRVSKVEMLSDRMRWYFQIFNNTNQDIEVGFYYRNTYLASESFDRYPVIEAEEAPNVDDSYHWLVQKGVRLDRWMDFPLPKNGAKTFTVGLVTYYEYGVRFPTFSVTLPQ